MRDNDCGGNYQGGKERVEKRKEEVDCWTAVEACRTAEEGRGYSSKVNEKQSRV